IDAADHDDRGPGAGRLQRRLVLGHQLVQLLFDHRQRVGHVNDASAKLRGDFVENLLGGRGAHVGANQNSVQLFQELVVDQLTFAFEQVANVGVQQLASSR